MKTELFVREEHNTPIWGEYDVVVCGGGVAGLAAAVAARRQGVSVLLLEKGVVLGGLATQGLISWYEPLCDGKGRRVMNGMAYELMRLAIRDGFDSLPDSWKNEHLYVMDTERRCSTFFSHSMFAMALDEWLTGAGAGLLLDTAVVGVFRESGKIQGVFVENKSGRGCYLARCVIDATGDADVALRAGVPCEDGLNYLTYIGYYTNREYARKAAGSGCMLNGFKWMNSGSDLWGKGHPEGMPFFHGISAEDETRFILEGRRRLFEKIRKEPAAERDITTLPGMAQFRKTRRIIGQVTIDESDENRHCAGSIGVIPDFSKPGALYEVPFGALYNECEDNLFVAGRIISSSGWAWDVTRVIPGAIMTGQAAGTAAALCVRNDCANRELDVSMLQQALKEQDVWISFES